jgi:hypothetical protein
VAVNNSIGFLVINVCNHGEHCEAPCITQLDVFSNYPKIVTTIGADHTITTHELCTLNLLLNTTSAETSSVTFFLFVLAFCLHDDGQNDGKM